MRRQSPYVTTSNMLATSLCDSWSKYKQDVFRRSCQSHFAPSTHSQFSLSLPPQPLPEWEYNGNAEQVGYRVEYSKAGSSGRPLTQAIADRLEREFTIEDLEEWTEYEVRVQALNGIGLGPWSQPIRGRTRESGELIFYLSALTSPLAIKAKCF